MDTKLTTSNHDTSVAGLTYVYPVISRRVGGLSVGINFNTNNACNWRCVYCQVPDLKLGAAPELDHALLEKELRYFLNEVLHGDFYERFGVAEENKVIKDIAIAGNGEPTSLKDFAGAIELIGRVATEMDVLPDSQFVLITNGSLVHQAKVQAGLRVLNSYGGEVWFKFDSATTAGRALINNTAQSWQASLENLIKSCQLCHTKIQTCLISYKHYDLLGEEWRAYLVLLTELKRLNVAIKDIMLYTLARPSLQPEAEYIQAVSLELLNALAEDIRLLGFNVYVNK